MEKLKNEVFFYLPTSTLNPTRVLSNGTVFPMITFGAFFLGDFKTVRKAIEVALSTGYRSFDIFPVCENDRKVGSALELLLPEYELSREDICIIIKLPRWCYEKESAKKAVAKTLLNLRTDYADFCLLQWPGGFNKDPHDPDNEQLRLQAWGALTELYRAGILKNLGLCNFTASQLRAFMDKCGEIKPVINQVEIHPRYTQKDVILAGNELGVQIQSMNYKGNFHLRILTDGVVKKIAKKLDKTCTQIVLKWILNKGVAVVAGAENPTSIEDNFKLYDFVIEKPEMNLFDTIYLREKYTPDSICYV